MGDVINRIIKNRIGSGGAVAKREVFAATLAFENK